ncbi:pyruvate dehydrogenase kinase, partial [Metarhizium brunneum ARSEF 3297]
MPGYIVTCKDDATEDQIKAAKQHALDQGGKITHEYTLIKGFARRKPQLMNMADFPNLQRVLSKRRHYHTGIKRARQGRRAGWRGQGFLISEPAEAIAGAG